MKKAQRDHFLRELQSAKDDFDVRVSIIADNLRTQVIIPVCKRHKLEFLSGNGRYFFTTNHGTQVSDGQFITNEEEGERYVRALKPVFELLDQEVTRDNPIGYYVEDVRKDDY